MKKQNAIKQARNFDLRPASVEEAGLFYTAENQDAELGTVGHLRMDFGSGGKGFYHTWWPHNGDRLNTPEFKEALQEFVDAMRQNGPLKDLSAMNTYCWRNGGEISDNDRVYGFIAETEQYRFCLRCTPRPGNHQGYLYCYDLRQQELARQSRLVGRVTFASGENQEFTDAGLYLQTIREELPYHAFRKENCSQDERWQKFVSRLEGKELTDRDLSPPLKALRDLQPGDLLFTEPAERMGRLLDFQVDCASDAVQMEVFGPKVNCTGSGSWLDIFVSYDTARQEVCDHLDLTLHRKDGAWEKSFRYDLAPEERKLLRTEMEAHCLEQYGKTLNGLYAERYFQEDGPPPVLDGGSQRLDVSALSFEGDISECDGKLNFYTPVTFDPDGVFGTNVSTEDNDDWINVYAGYDLETGEPEPSLAVILVCGDGNVFEFSYPLTAPEREQLREKMDTYCCKQHGVDLEKMRAACLREEPDNTPGLQM